MTHSSLSAVRRFPVILTLLPLLALLAAVPARACTLFGAAGDAVEGGGTLVAKNRDFAPSSRMRLEVVAPVAPQTGYRYLSLSGSHGGRLVRARAGINEKGLVLATAAANTLERRLRHLGRPGLADRLLRECASVDEVLGRGNELAEARPGFYLVGDAREVAVIEIGPKGAVAVRRTESGALTHTNHYLDPRLRELNTLPYVSSVRREERVCRLLGDVVRPLCLEDARRFAADREDGPDDGIFRTGGTPDGVRTLASWLVLIPPSGAPTLSVRLFNTGEAGQSVDMALDDAFWSRAEPGPLFPPAAPAN